MFADHQYLEFASPGKKLYHPGWRFITLSPETFRETHEVLRRIPKQIQHVKTRFRNHDIYESSQPTLPRKSFNQGCCRLPHNKYQFALKSINQLETAGVVQTSDSPLRSNVVLAPKSAYEKMNVK
jgi:hypothetical protein